jgi:hypothetical protein
MARCITANRKDYPYRVAVPLNNLYGMHLYSRLPLIESEIKFILSDEIPSIHATLTLNAGNIVQLYCLSKPPSPTNERFNAKRR